MVRNYVRRDVGGRGKEGGEGGMTVIHIIIAVFNSNPMAPHYLNNNHVTYYVIT